MPWAAAEGEGGGIGRIASIIPRVPPCLGPNKNESETEEESVLGLKCVCCGGLEKMFDGPATPAAANLGAGARIICCGWVTAGLSRRGGSPMDAPGP